ncbi:MAG: hypothetical protein DHS20C12_11830 [Pseudohongiella sp.]|nr:MAG: hypothetical protein DHS20C12_11830 [Pseudohongiella sp.]
MNLLRQIAEIVAPVTKVIDELHTSEEEKMAINASIIGLQNTVTEKLIEYETKLLDSQASIITAEAAGKSWIQRSWRPITMLTFLVLVVCDSFGLLAFRLSPDAWDLLKIGLGGYVVGRSAEKIAPQLSANVKSSDGNRNQGETREGN